MDGESFWEILWLEHDIDGIGERKLRMTLRHSDGVEWAKVKPLPFSLFLLLPVVPLTPTNK